MPFASFSGGEPGITVSGLSGSGASYPTINYGYGFIVTPDPVNQQNVVTVNPNLIGSGSVGPPGPTGPLGIGVAAVTTSVFTMPATGSSSTVNVTSGSLFSPGNAATMVSGTVTNWFQVVTGSGSTLTLFNGYLANSPAGSVFPASSSINVSSNAAPISSSIIGAGQALVLNAQNQLVPQAHPFVWNVQSPINGQPGAKGDGVTDDTAALQRALNMFSGPLNPACGTLYFPQGKYLISNSLTLVGNSANSVLLQGEVAGEGALGSVIRWTGASSTLVNYSGSFGVTMGSSTVSCSLNPVGSIPVSSTIHFASQGQDYTIVGLDTGSLTLNRTYFGNINTVTTAQSASIPTMMHWYGVNRSGIRDIFFDGNGKAFSNLWLHTNQPFGGQASAGLTFYKCYFMGTVGVGYTDLTYAGTQGAVLIGDYNSPGNDEEVATIELDRCVVSGNDQAGGTFSCVNVLGGFNTEQFMFKNMTLQDSLYGITSYWFPNNEMWMDNVSFFHNVANVVLGFGAGTVRMTNCLCEASSFAAPWTGKTKHVIIGGGFNHVYINGGEITIDCSQNPFGQLIDNDGWLKMSNCIVDGGGALFAHAAVIRGGAQSNKTFPGRWGIDIDNCSWLGATQQVPCTDDQGNPITLYGDHLSGSQNNFGSSFSYNVKLWNNHGTANGGGSVFYFPTLIGDRLQMHSVGGIPGGFGQDAGTTFVAANQVRTTTTIYTVSFTSLTGSAGTTQTLSKELTIPNKVAVLRVVADVTTAFSGSGGLTSLSASVGDSKYGNSCYLLSHDMTTATTTYPIGGSAGDLGTALTTSSSQGGFYGLWNVAGFPQPTINVAFTSTGANLSALTAGSLTVAVTTEALYG